MQQAHLTFKKDQHIVSKKKNQWLQSGTERLFFVRQSPMMEVQYAIFINNYVISFGKNSFRRNIWDAKKNLAHCCTETKISGFSSVKCCLHFINMLLTIPPMIILVSCLKSCLFWSTGFMLHQLKHTMFMTPSIIHSYVD